jgi:hypothetical protein
MVRRASVPTTHRYRPEVPVVSVTTLAATGCIWSPTRHATVLTALASDARAFTFVFVSATSVAFARAMTEADSGSRAAMAGPAVVRATVRARTRTATTEAQAVTAPFGTWTGYGIAPATRRQHRVGSGLRQVSAFVRIGCPDSSRIQCPDSAGSRTVGAKLPV